MKLSWLLYVLMGFSVLLVLVIVAYYGISSEKLTANRVQHALDRSETLIDNNVEQLSSLFQDENIFFDKFVNAVDDDLLVYVFCEDSLVVWNSNLVDPKFLKKRVGVPSDTVCNLLYGDFLVRSFSQNDYYVYVLSLLCTTFSLENSYLPNFFNVPFFPQSNHVVLNPEDGTFPLYNSSGQVASRFDIVTYENTSFPYVYLIYFLVIVAVVVASTLLFGFFSKNTRFSNSLFYFGELTVLIIVFACAAAVLTYFYDRNMIREEERLMRQTAFDLFDERDIDFESSFHEFSRSVSSDTMLLKMVFSDNNMVDDVVSGYAENLLFDSVMKAYNMSMTVCVPGQEILVDGTGAVGCDDYFNDVLAHNNASMISEDLYFVDYATLDPNYLGIITLKLNDTLPPRRLYFEFYKQVTPNGFGLPSILQNRNDMIPAGFSVVSYRNNMLIYKYGSYIYPNHLTDYRYKANGFYYGGRTKNFSVVEDNKALIINCERRGWVALTAPFAVFFLGFVIVYLVIFAFTRNIRDLFQGGRSLRRKFQVAIMVTMLIAFGIVGPVSILYMKQLYDNKAKEFNFEQTRSVLLDLSREISYARLDPSQNPSETELLLKELSNTFFVDINLYDTEGKLIATSRPELFEYKLQAPLMNAHAFANLNDDKSLYYTNIEKVGKNKYQSNYIAVTGDNGETMAFLNIPYFSADENIHREVVNFALAYVNIILLLIGISSIVVMLVMRRITKPLLVLQEQMAKFNMSHYNNEIIDLDGDDEVGQLVMQYNKLVVQLGNDTSRMVKEEREAAWRGMARQVAHEIKNPLTPMRLSIQYLQRAWNEQSPDIDLKFKKTTTTLIEEIDNLSNIASAFSDYAKLPEGNPAPLDLKQILEKSINLYDNEENIKFNFVWDDDATFEFTADANNLSRAFGNVIKNAIQAIGKKPDGLIDIRLMSRSGRYVISISDNGKGIKDEDKGSIFMPNFTTKSSGMGIGLSIVRNIIQASNGRITFESTENVGTTFNMEFYKE